MDQNTAGNLFESISWKKVTENINNNYENIRTEAQLFFETSVGKEIKSLIDIKVIKDVMDEYERNRDSK